MQGAASVTQNAPSEIPQRNSIIKAHLEGQSLPKKDDISFARILGDFNRIIWKKLTMFRRKAVTGKLHNIQILHHDEITELGVSEPKVKDKDTPVESNIDRFNSYVIHPNNPFRRAFDAVTVFLVIYLIYKVPFDFAFDWYTNTNAEEAWLLVLDFWFFIDICLNFKTGYISNGTAVMHPKMVMYHYLTNWFLIDLIGTIPYKYFIADGERGKSVKLAKFFKIPKLLRVSRILKYLRNNR